MTYLDNFNKTLQELLVSIYEIYPDLKDIIMTHYHFPLNGDTYLNTFLENCENKGFDISTKNEFIFSENSIIIEHVEFYKLWNDEDIDEEYKENIWKYLHTLYIYSIEYKYDKNVKTLYNELKQTDTKVSEEMQTFFNIIDSLKTNIENNENIDSIKLDDDLGNIEDTDGEHSTFNMPDLFGGTIGNLAKEIADEIDPSTLNLDDPNQLLQNLMSGNLDNDTSGIKELVSNITGKIHEKLNSGEVNEESLFKEATGMMDQLNSKNQSNPFASMFGNLDLSKFNPEEMVNNPMFNNLNQNMPNKVDKSKLNNRIELEERRERLRKKLEAKQQKLQESTIQIHSDIENNPNSKLITNKPKRKRKKKKGKTSLGDTSEQSNQF